MSLSYRAYLQQMKSKGGGLPNRGAGLPNSNPYGKTLNIPVQTISFKRKEEPKHEQKQVEIKDGNDDDDNDSSPPLPNEQISMCIMMVFSVGSTSASRSCPNRPQVLRNSRDFVKIFRF